MQPSKPRIRTRRLALLAVAAAATTGLMAAPGASAAASEPIVFVHGYTGAAWNWDTMKSKFKADGWTDAQLTAKTYSSSKSNKEVAKDVAAEIDRVLAATGASKVDVITHSMGGLSSRWFLKFMSGTGKVDDWVSMAGPNHGSTNAAWCTGTVPCGEMTPGSAFLTELNAGDETPGAVNYGTWYSPCDTTATPPETTALSGAKNTKTACISHTDFLFNTTVYTQVRDFVR